LAGPVGAKVSEGAGISVITGHHHRLIDAFPVSGAAIHGTRIIVTAFDRLANAYAFFAMVLNRARIPI